MYPSGFVDKTSGLSVKAFAERVDQIIAAAHADGTLKAMSIKWLARTTPPRPVPSTSRSSDR